MDSETKFNEKKAAAPTETGETRGDAGLATRTEAKPEGRATERSEGEGRNYRDGARPYHSSGATSSTGAIRRVARTVSGVLRGGGASRCGARYVAFAKTVQP